MKSNEVKIGMKVWVNLKGSPEMLVHSLVRPNMWMCQWFVKGELKSKTFSSEQLTDKDPNDKPRMVTNI